MNTSVNLTGTNSRPEDRWQPVVLQAQQQDSAAWLCLLEEFENVIQGACRRFTVPHSEIGDLQQAAYEGFCRAVCSFDPTRGVTFARYAQAKAQEAVWQYMRVRNRHLRREQTEGQPSGDDDAAGSRLEQVADEGSAEGFSELEWRSLLSSLSEREALAVERIVIDGLSMADLAREEGVSPGTVKTWKQRALVKIREELKKTRV